MNIFKHIITRLQRVASTIGSPAAESDLPLAEFGLGDQAKHIDNKGNSRIGSGLREEAGHAAH